MYQYAAVLAHPGYPMFHLETISVWGQQQGFPVRGFGISLLWVCTRPDPGRRVRAVNRSTGFNLLFDLMQYPKLIVLVRKQEEY